MFRYIRSLILRRKIGYKDPCLILLTWLDNNKHTNYFRSSEVVNNKHSEIEILGVFMVISMLCMRGAILGCKWIVEGRSELYDKVEDIPVEFHDEKISTVYYRI